MQFQVFRLDSGRFKNLSHTERSTFNSAAEQYCSRAETALKAAFLVLTETLSATFCDAPFHYSVQCEHSLILAFHRVKDSIYQSSKVMTAWPMLQLYRALDSSLNDSNCMGLGFSTFLPFSFLTSLYTHFSNSFPFLL